MKSIEEIIQINKKQKEFYNTKNKNFATRIWSSVRHGLLSDIRKEIGITNQVYETHKIWLGDLSKKKVLDLGCFSGNNLSVYMAEHAMSYTGLDLSDKGIEILNKKIKNYPNANAIAADFLSEEAFPEKDFDVIYAYGVLHHFQNVEVLLNRLNNKLSKNGFVISYDPLATNFFVKIFRTLYRPFQSDKEWEWPFTKKTYYKFIKYFNITNKHGVLGKTKWFFLINIIPFSKDKKIKIGRKWHNDDWNLSSNSNKKILNCMHLTMKFYKK
jgi:2-polyprenyl-3-methyl-5-hydroxy-6-metoxy-1,4-benzoquinol methylase